MSSPPTGTVTFLFTDIEGSTKLWEQNASAMHKALARHDEILRDAIEERGGYVFQLVAVGLPSEFPPLRTLEGRPNNLPSQPTPLVGRERGVEEVAERLGGEEVRLLTLTGPGGTGKTRLALQAGADLLEGFEDGAFFVSLATMTDPELMPSAIAGPLGVKESAEQPLLGSLKSYLHHKDLLLILDNFEQVLEEAPVVGELVGACPKLKVLATSRIPLRLYGEQEYPVPPLALPDPRVLPPLKVLTQYEAVRLFVERARAVKADFEVTNENAPAVAEICARLDGLPLAIELAAARVRILPPQKVLERLSNHLKLLKGGARDLPTRQQTLRGTIDWSYDLLEEGEQTLFGRLSVFAGGRTLEAIEEICDPDGDLDALEGVESLVEKNLLRQEEGVGGEPRFVMLETVHEYAREKLQESAEAEGIKRLHAEYFLTLAEEAFPELKGANQLQWLQRLEAEHDNMRAALSWVLERKEAELALSLGDALLLFWYLRGHYSEGRRWLEEALAMDGRGSPEVRAMALAGVGILASDQGDYDRVQEACQEGLELLTHEASEPSEAKLWLLASLGWVALEREEHGRATQLYEESLALSREMSDTWWIATSLLNLAIVPHSLGDYERATELYEESMDLFRELGNKQGLALCLTNLAMTVYSQGDLGRAAQLTEEAIALHRELDDRGDVALGLCNLGWLALLQDDLGGAADLYRESLSLSWDLGLNPVVQGALEGFACVAGSKGETERAARLWGSAQTLHETKGITRDPDFLAEADARISAVRSGMGEEAWEAAWGKGQAMTIEEAISYALEGAEE